MQKMEKFLKRCNDFKGESKLIQQHLRQYGTVILFFFDLIVIFNIVIIFLKKALIDSPITMKTGRPHEDSFHLKFISRASHKKKVIISLTNLLMSLYIASPILAVSGNKVSRRQRQQLEVSQLQLEETWIGSLNRDRKLMILDFFSKISGQFTFSGFDQATMPKKFFSDPYDLSFIFLKILSSQTKQIPIQQQVFLCLLCLWKSQELNKQLLSYFQQNMKYILEEVKNGIQYLCSIDLQTVGSSQEQGQQNENQYEYNFDSFYDQFIGVQIRERIQSGLSHSQEDQTNQKKQNKKSEENIIKHKKIQKKKQLKVSKKNQRQKIRQRISRQRMEQQGNSEGQVEMVQHNPMTQNKKKKKCMEKEAPNQLAINFSKYICYCYHYAKLPESQIR